MARRRSAETDGLTPIRVVVHPDAGNRSGPAMELGCPPSTGLSAGLIEEDVDGHGTSTLRRYSVELLEAGWRVWAERVIQQNEMCPRRVRVDPAPLGPSGLTDAHRPRRRFINVHGRESGGYQKTP